MLMASKPAKILREEEEAMHAASKAMQLEKPLGDDEYQGPAVSDLTLFTMCYRVVTNFDVCKDLSCFMLEHSLSY